MHDGPRVASPNVMGAVYALRVRLSTGTLAARPSWRQILCELSAGVQTQRTELQHILTLTLAPRSGRVLPQTEQGEPGYAHACEALAD